MCIFEAFYFGTGINFPTLRTLDQVLSALFTTVILFRKPNFLKKMRQQNMRLTLRLSSGWSIALLIQLILRYYRYCNSYYCCSYYYYYYYNCYEYKQKAKAWNPVFIMGNIVICSQKGKRFIQVNLVQVEISFSY